MFGTLSGILVRSLNGERQTELGMSDRKVWVQLQRPAKRPYSLVVAAHPPKYYAVRGVCPGVPLIEAERSPRFRHRLGQNRPDAPARPRHGSNEHPREQAVGLT